jgi:hypothetical protein
VTDLIADQKRGLRELLAELEKSAPEPAEAA